MFVPDELMSRQRSAVPFHPSINMALNLRLVFFSCSEYQIHQITNHTSIEMQNLYDLTIGQLQCLVSLHLNCKKIVSFFFFDYIQHIYVLLITEQKYKYACMYARRHITSYSSVNTEIYDLFFKNYLSKLNQLKIHLQRTGFLFAVKRLCVCLFWIRVLLKFWLKEAAVALRAYPMDWQTKYLKCN